MVINMRGKSKGVVQVQQLWSNTQVRKSQVWWDKNPSPGTDMLDSSSSRNRNVVGNIRLKPCNEKDHKGGPTTNWQRSRFERNNTMGSNQVMKLMRNGGSMANVEC